VKLMVSKGGDPAAADPDPPERHQAARAPLAGGASAGRRAPLDAARQRAGTTDIRLSVHEDLDEIQPAWCDFEQRADCTVFQLFGWLSTWQTHVGARSGTQPVIVIGRDDQGDILFLLPLAVERRGFFRCLGWLGSDHSDYNAPLLAPHFSQAMDRSAFLSRWPQILERIQRERHFDMIHFIRMPETVGNQENPFVRLRVVPHASGAYLTHLTGDWESFYARSRSQSTRRRDRTKRNRLGDLGDVRFVTATAADGIGRSIDALIAQKTRAFAQMRVPNIFERPGCAAFYRALATDTAMAHIVHVSRLDVGTVPAAVNLGLRFRGCYHHLLASHELGEMSRFSPGAAHLHELMRYAIEAGCKAYDFTIGDETYKKDWSDTETVLFHHVAAARWRGALVAAPLRGLIRFKHAGKRVLAALRALQTWSALTRILARRSKTGDGRSSP
jgi:CelD/BcsL family acetyltransferase involved in cellulose biosynthesis